MTDLQTIIDSTNQKLSQWYDNARRDYGVDGSATCKYENNLIIIDYIEDGEEKQFSYGYYPEEKKDYYFNVWMEQD